MKRSNVLLVLAMFMLSLAVILGGCSGGGTGGSSGSGTGSTVVSGKVTLSSSIVTAGKTQLTRSKFLSELAALQPPLQGAADRPAYLPSFDLLSKLNAPSFATALANAQVDMYDADHPEWLHPVASGSTDADATIPCPR
ncbi:MAG: hypothetical protein ACYC7L_07930 [Nitrospirota bacterium]